MSKKDKKKKKSKKDYTDTIKFQKKKQKWKESGNYMGRISDTES